MKCFVMDDIGVLPGSSILGARACDAPEREGSHRKGEKMQKWGAGSTKAQPPTSQVFQVLSMILSKQEGERVPTQVKIIRSQNYQSFWKMNKCHSLIFWKDSHLELTQELCRTCSALHTRVIASFHLPMMLGDRPHSCRFFRWENRGLQNQ